MIQRTVKVELTVDEVHMLGEMARDRMSHLATQPPSAECYEEMTLLANFAEKMLTPAAALDHAEKLEWKAGLN